MASSLSIPSKAITIPEFSPSAFERASYYNGITGDDDHPVLIYRSDFRTRPFTKPTGRFAPLPIKSLHGVFDTPLNKGKIWVTVGLQIVHMIKAQKISLTSIDPARFFTHPTEEGEEGSLGPVVIWVGVKPDTTSSETAHKVSQDILALLRANGIEDIEVEWREAVLQRLAGPPLLPAVDISDATHNVRRFLTPLHGVPLAAQDLDEGGGQGTLTLWFHENLDKDGKPSNKVFGVTNCHVLRKDTTVDYEHRGDTALSYVRVCGSRRFDRGLSEITDKIADHTNAADALAKQITKFQAKEQTKDTVRVIEMKQWSLDRETEAVNNLSAFYADTTRNWSQINLHRNIGYTQFAPAITVDVKGGTLFTSDWGVFVATEDKVKDAFEGNMVYLGTKYTPRQLDKMFYPIDGGPPTDGSPTTFKWPDDGKFRIEGWSALDELLVPEDINSKHQRFVMVAKDGNTTDLTIGRYAGLLSFTENEFGITSMEIGIYNAGNKIAEVFSDRGDSGALVWHMKEGRGYIIGQLHSGDNKGGSTSNHVSYCTPGETLRANIMAKFPHADFFRTKW